MSRGLRFARLFGLPDQRVVGVALALLIVSLTSPAAAATLLSVPWAVEAPRAAEKRFSIGTDVFGERQESLRIAAFEQLLTVVDLSTGVEESTRLPGDSELLNRKFDLSFERHGVGSSFGMALPDVGFFGAGTLHPTLTVGAATADVSLDFDDVTRSEDSTSLRGRGALFETRLDLVATLCQSCSWFTATSYRFETLPTLSVDRSPRFASQGFTVPRDEVRLGRQVQEISTRVGYKLPGGRTASFAGVQHRWTDLDLDDRLAYRNAFSETRLSSRTRLESQTTLAVAGVDVEIGGGFFSRLETAVGGGDTVVRLNVAYLPDVEKPGPDPTGHTDDIEPWKALSINLTLDELAWPVTALQVRRPEAIEPLFAASGERLADLLEAAGIAVRGLAKRTARADSVRPLIFVMRLDTELDLDRRLRELGVGADRISRKVPPMIVDGPRARLLVVFVSEVQTQARRPDLSKFVLARWEGAPGRPGWQKIGYSVTPRPWTRGSTKEITHSICADPRVVVEIVTWLKYGGAPPEVTPALRPDAAKWKPGCDDPDRDIEGMFSQHYDIPQKVTQQPPGDIVLAGAYFDDDATNSSFLKFEYIRVDR